MCGEGINMSGLSVPIGAVLPYAGNLNNNNLNEMGWSICNGAQLAIDQYPDLFKCLGTCNGGDGNQYFNLPDYQGMFLRGVDTVGTVDKGAKSRTAPASGGASGPHVGSIEGYATAAPTTPFTALVPHVPTNSHDAYSGSNADMLNPGGAQTFSSNGGGDAETRPINAYVNYIIKLVQGAAIPTGAVVAYAGDSPNGSQNLLTWYRVCDGSSIAQNLYPNLYQAIGTAHGGNATMFNLPDYQGYFLRGVDNDATRDPDQKTRTAMNPGGSTGNAVGSVQAYATALPTTPFTISFNLGSNDKESDHCAGHSNSMWNSGAVQVPFTASGGDNESRPVNAYVDYYVLFQADPNTADIFPIGAVIGFPGNVAPNDSQWLLCDGSSLPTTGQFALLYDAISTDNGCDASGSFSLPDYRGYFIRGADRGKGRDPDANTRSSRPGGASGDVVGSIQSYATGRPKSKDIYSDIPHVPTDEGDNAAAIWCSEVAEWDGAQTCKVSGGDPETRPVNANILFYIKYAQTTS